MKKILIVIVSIFSLAGCEPGSCTTENETIVNNSGRDVEVYSYTRDDGILRQKVSIKKLEKLHEQNRECPPGDYDYNFYYFIKGDSIVIDYGDKIKSHGLNILKKDERNPYYLDYQNHKNGSDNFVYTLTPEDYANATPKL